MLKTNTSILLSRLLLILKFFFANFLFLQLLLFQFLLLLLVSLLFLYSYPLFLTILHIFRLLGHISLLLSLNRRGLIFRSSLEKRRSHYLQELLFVAFFSGNPFIHDSFDCQILISLPNKHFQQITFIQESIIYRFLLKIFLCLRSLLHRGKMIGFEQHFIPSLISCLQEQIYLTKSYQHYLLTIDDFCQLSHVQALKNGFPISNKESVPKQLHFALQEIYFMQVIESQLHAASKDQQFVCQLYRTDEFLLDFFRSLLQNISFSFELFDLFLIKVFDCLFPLFFLIQGWIFYLFEREVLLS